MGQGAARGIEISKELGAQAQSPSHPQAEMIYWYLLNQTLHSCLDLKISI